MTGKTQKSKMVWDWEGWPSKRPKMPLKVICWVKLYFQNFCLAVIPSESPTLEASRAFLRHKKFECKSKMSKIKKDENLVGWAFGSQKMSIQMIFWAKLNLQIFCLTVISSEGLALEASRIFRKHKNFDGKTKMSKIKKDEYWIGWTSGSQKMKFQMICWAKLDLQDFCPAVISSERLTL